MSYAEKLPFLLVDPFMAVVERVLELTSQVDLVLDMSSKVEIRDFSLPTKEQHENVKPG